MTATTAFRMGRRQTIGVLFGLLGLFLVGYVATNLDPMDRGLSFEPPPDPVKLVVDPAITVTAIGVVFVLAAVATFFERRSTRLARGALVVATVLFIPLVVVLALALSETRDTNVMQLLVESLRLGTPVALGAMAGAALSTVMGSPDVAKLLGGLGADMIGFVLVARLIFPPALTVVALAPMFAAGTDVGSLDTQQVSNLVGYSVMVAAAALIYVRYQKPTHV